MYQQTSLFFYKCRYLVASMLTVAFLMLISGIVTHVGSNSVLAHPETSSLSTSVSDDPNVVADGVSSLTSDGQGLLLSMGSGLYRSCRSFTTTSDHIGDDTITGVATVLSDTLHGIAATGRGVGDVTMATIHGIGVGVMFTIRTPGRIVGSVTRASNVNALIKPTDASTPTPVISNETSTAVLADFNAAEQQTLAKLQAQQLAANKQLDGVLIAGDPAHGGYPDTWNNAPQDSMLDSWGMYNRECVSYTAWKVYQTYGSMPYWGGEGNANQWVGDAQRAGIPTGTTPKVGSVAIWRVGYYGHAMWVEKVDGNMIYVSQYNYSLNGKYSEMWVNGSNFTYIYFH